MQNVLTHTCKSCNARVPFESLRYNDATESLVCANCYARQPAPKVKAKEGGSVKESRARMVCQNCKYKFLLNPRTKPICPNCGKTDIEEEVSAQNLVDTAHPRDE
jgi:hypothetical protein